MVEGYSAALYLQGEGSIVFVDAQTGALEHEVAIVPGRMIVWENASLLHKVDAGNSLTPRVMLGGCVCECHVLLSSDRAVKANEGASSVSVGGEW